MDDVVAVVPDLYFQSRISAAARHQGRVVRFVGPAQLTGEVNAFRLALIDLDAAPDIAPVIRALRASASGPIIVFGPHVDTEKRKTARSAGADRVLARSKFVSDLPQILAGKRDET